MSSERVTIRDVARAAGVSVTTVSHVLNDRGRISPATQQRVRRHAETLGYRANPIAQRLRDRQFGSIGLCLPERSLNYVFYTDLVVAASRAGFAGGQTLNLIPPTADPALLQSLPLESVIVVEPGDDDPVMERLSGLGVRLVLCEAPPGDGSTAADLPAGSVTIDLDHERGLTALLDHLRRQDARRIHALVPEAHSWWARHLLTVCMDWSTPRAAVTVSTIPFAASRTTIREIAEDALTSDPRPDALVVAQQGVGETLLVLAERLGLDVPGDLLLASTVDGPDLWATQPQITALDLHAAETGRLAVEALLDRRTRSVTVPQTLRVRASTTR